MKIEELMAGDWIYPDDVSDFPVVKVVLIENWRIGFALPDKNGAITGELAAWNKPDKVRPVPLTPAVSEKSGFERYDTGGDMVTMWTGYGEDNKDDLEVEFRKEEITVKFDVVGHYYHSTSIKYVHQLQNALRMCEIDKEIKVL